MKGLVLGVWLAMVLPLHAQDTCFVSQPIPDGVFARMQGKSYPKDCPTPRAELRYLSLSYRDARGQTRQGEMVCHRRIAADLVSIFRQLWLADYRIERMQLVDDYGADDQRSMAANNTSCFNFRYISGTRTVSKHGQGMAVDINPLYNPYVYTRGGVRRVEPLAGRPYATHRERLQGVPFLITRSDLCYRLFRQHGFRWGGDWTRSKDYQHFEK